MQTNIEAENYRLNEPVQGVPIQQYPPNQQIQQGYPMQQQFPPQQPYLPPQYQQYGQQQPFMGNVSSIIGNQIPVIIQPISAAQMMRRKNADGCAYPADLDCPYCLKPIQTYVREEVGTHTWIAVILLLIFFFPLFFLPFCFDDCKDKIHFCPSCGKKVGKKKYKIC